MNVKDFRAVGDSLTLNTKALGMKAKAAIVVSNVHQFSLDGLGIIWNQTDTIPHERKHPERIEHGKLDKVHYLTYDKVKMAEFSALYTSNVEGVYISPRSLKARPLICPL